MHLFWGDILWKGYEEIHSVVQQVESKSVCPVTMVTVVLLQVSALFGNKMHFVSLTWPRLLLDHTAETAERFFGLRKRLQL